MANHFNDLLLQTLKQINVRLDRLDGRMDRLDGRMDRLMETKADKTDLAATNEKLDVLMETKADKTDLAATNEKLDALTGEVKNIGSRMDRLEAGIGTLKWIVGAEVAVIGVVLAFIKAC